MTGIYAIRGQRSVPCMALMKPASSIGAFFLQPPCSLGGREEGQERGLCPRAPVLPGDPAAQRHQPAQAEGLGLGHDHKRCGCGGGQTGGLEIGLPRGECVQGRFVFIYLIIYPYGHPGVMPLILD